MASSARITRSPAARASPPGGLGRERLAAFDGLRGVAALAVVAFHYDTTGPMRLGYLAVDLFFLLSGFVVAAAYETRLRGGDGLAWFAGVRMARLYPLHLLGLALGAGAFLILGAAPMAVAGSFVASALFLPNPILSADLFPLNGPAWSLALEVAVNIVFAAGAYRISTRRLAAVVLAMAVALAAAILIAESGSAGAEADTFWIGLLRVGFGFPAGVLIWRLHSAGALPRARLPAGLLLAAVLASFTAPSFNGLANIAIVLALYPAVVVLGLSATPPQGRAGWAYAFAGRASYACYALHMPLGALFAVALGHWGLASGLGLFPTFLIVLAAAHWFEPWGKRAVEQILARRRLGLGGGVLP